MTDQLSTLLRQGAETLAEHVRLEPPGSVFREGLRRRRRRSVVTGGAAALVAVTGVLGWVAVAHGHGQPGSLAGDGGSARAGGGRYLITIETAPSAPSDLPDELAQCAHDAGATRQPGDDPHQQRYRTASTVAGAELIRCASAKIGVVRVAGVDAGEASPAASFSEQAVGALPGTLRSTGIGNVQTWLSDVQDGLGPQLCWGQPDPFISACSASVREGSDQPARPYTGLNPPSEDPRSRLIAGVVATDATGGLVQARGRTFMAAVEHYDQFPGLAIVVAQYDGEHVRGEDFGPITFLPNDEG